MRALRRALVPFSKGLSIVHPRQPQGLPLRLEAGDNWKALMTRRKCPEVCYVPSLAHRRGSRLSMGATWTNCPPPPAHGGSVNGGGMLGHWGGVKLYHLVCSCPPKKSELSGQHKCPCQLLREMPCRRVGQQMAGRKVLMQPILREARLKVGRQRSPCYA